MAKRRQVSGAVQSCSGSTAENEPEMREAEGGTGEKKKGARDWGRE